MRRRMSKELAKYGIKTVTNLATAEEDEVPYVEDRRRYVHHDQRPDCYCRGLHRGFVGVSVMSCCRGPFAAASPPAYPRAARFFSIPSSFCVGASLKARAAFRFCTVPVGKKRRRIACGDAHHQLASRGIPRALDFDYSLNTQAARQRRQVLQQIELAFFP